MILVIIICVWFYRMAKKNDLAPTLWVVSSGLSYFIGQIIAGVVIGLVAPEIVNSYGPLFIISLLSGMAAVMVVYFVMQNAIKNKDNSNNDNDDFILDNESSNSYSQKEGDY